MRSKKHAKAVYRRCMTDFEEAPVTVFACGPSTATCVCECATGGSCGHRWDGKGEEILYEDGGGMSSVSCSKCGMLAIGHSMWALP